MKKIKILLVDDHQIIRDGLCKLLNDQETLTVIGEAENGRKAIAMAEQLSPDIIIMDVSMPDLNGFEATAQILQKNSETKIIALSMHSERHFVEKMFKSGAMAYVLKDCAFDELIEAIKMVESRKYYLSPGITTLVLEDYVRLLTKKHGTEETVSQTNTAILSIREREVLQLLAEGKTTKEISHKLHVSLKTIETHRSNIMKKLGLHSIAELTKYAIRQGLTTL